MTSNPATAGRTSLEAMLEARSVALVGATPRQGTLGWRALLELERSPAEPAVHLVNRRRRGERIRGRVVLSSVEEIADPVDLVLFAVGEDHLEAAFEASARHGDRGGVVFANAWSPAGETPSLRTRLARIAEEAGMALCGAGCMGFVSQSVRAIGYLEPAPLPTGPIALVSHSGSMFSALLRADRPFSWSLAVSSGQELVTTAAEFAEYALTLPETRIVVLVLETLRAPDRLRAVLTHAQSADVPVVVLTVGASARGATMVAAHSGALAGTDGAWEALCDRHGVLRVGDAVELCDTVELLVSGRRAPGHGGRTNARPPAAARGGRSRGEVTDHGRGIAAVLDSGAERALIADVAERVGLPFARISPSTSARLSAILDPGLDAVNPLDVWGRGHSTEELFTESLVALAEDPAVDAVALAVDLVPELDGDESYPAAVVAAWNRTSKPLCVLSHVPSALDRDCAHKLRSQGIPVLEGTRSGLLALALLLAWRDHASRPEPLPPAVDHDRRRRWRARLEQGGATPTGLAELLGDYGLSTLPCALVASGTEAAAAADRLGYPVALKTAEPGVVHKSDVGGVVLGLESAAAVEAAYRVLADRLGPSATVAPMAPPGPELSVGVVRDPLLGPLVVVGAGGTLVELLADRAVALPPLGDADAERMVDRLGVRPLLDGYRDVPPAALPPVLGAITAVSTLAVELGDVVRSIEVNPLRCTASAAIALDALVET